VTDWAALRATDPKTIVGLMSGTSADGIDAVVVRVHGSGVQTRVEIVASAALPYQPQDRQELFALFSPPTGTVERICAFNFRLGALLAQAAGQAIAAAQLRPNQVHLIASHGQTIYHIPPQPASAGSSLQIGEAAVIAERLGIPVVSDFRVRDMAAGGQGAPLVTYADYLLFRDERRTRAVQNLGGIGNVTYLPARGGLDAVLAFDTGPGNMVINGLVELISGGVREFDRDGALAAAGRPDMTLVETLLKDPYFSLPPPKTTGREKFGQGYAAELLVTARHRGLSDADAVATATRLTVESIARAYRAFLLPRGGLDDVIIGGGGSHNPVLREWLTQALRPVQVRTTDEWGISSKAKEAVAFAILANEAVAGNPSNVPSATGAAHPVVLGKLVPA
jgi:anhydro-N-acetylmuramic acid kinase